MPDLDVLFKAVAFLGGVLFCLYICVWVFN